VKGEVNELTGVGVGRFTKRDPRQPCVSATGRSPSGHSLRQRTCEALTSGDAGRGLSCVSHSRLMSGIPQSRPRGAPRQWLTGVLDRHPDLIVENCASGAMRQDYALLALCHLLPGDRDARPDVPLRSPRPDDRRPEAAGDARRPDPPRPSARDPWRTAHLPPGAPAMGRRLDRHLRPCGGGAARPRSPGVVRSRDRCGPRLVNRSPRLAESACQTPEIVPASRTGRWGRLVLGDADRRPRHVGERVGR
jgi:hypothetical protein